MSTPYRNDVDALHERKESLEREAGQLRAHTSQLDGLRAREAAIAAELADIERKLEAGAKAKRALPVLEDIRVASPCTANWDEMVGDAQVRFCLSCEKNVFNLSAMARPEAEALLASRTSEMCVRYYRRADGTILTSDCPVGVKKKRRKKLALAVAGVGAMAVAATQVYARATACGTATMGEPAGEFMTGAMPVAPANPTPHVMGTAAPPPPAVPSAAPSQQPHPRPKDFRQGKMIMGDVAE